MISVRDARATDGYLVAIRDEMGACSLVDLTSYMHGKLAPCADPAMFRTLLRSRRGLDPTRMPPVVLCK